MDDGLNKNQKIMGALTLSRDDACLQKEAALRNERRAKTPEKKAAFATEAAAWARREAKWIEELQFRVDIGFTGG